MLAGCTHSTAMLHIHEFSPINTDQRGPQSSPGDRSREAANDRDVAIFIHDVSNVQSNATYRIEVVWRCNRKASLNDVHSQLGQLPSDVQLLLAGKGCSW